MNPDTQPYTPGEGDAAIEMLREIFGNAVSTVLGAGPAAAQHDTANMLGTAFGFFNSGVLFFGAIILTWVTVFGVANTANDGQVLGRKWSTFYTPLRTFSASAFLIPSSSGYSAVQLAILLIVSWSVGFASNMWGKVVDYVVTTEAVEQAVKSVQEDPNFDNLAYSALRMQVCAYAVSQGVSQTLGQAITLQPTFTNASDSSSSLNPYQSTTYTTTISMRYSNWPGSEDICGKMVISNTYVKPDTNSGSSQDVATSVKNAVNTIHYKYASSLVQGGQIGGLARTIIQAAETQGGQVSAQAISDGVASIRQQMMSEIIAEVRNQVSKENSNLAQKFKEKGWVYAGSLHRELARIKDSIRSVSTTKSEYVSGTSYPTHLLSGSVAVAVRSVMERYDALLSAVIQKSIPSTASTSGKPVLPSIQTSFTASDFADGGNGIKSRITSYYSKIPDTVLRGLMFYLAEDGSDPVMQVKNIGDWMATVAETLMVAKAFMASSLKGVLTALVVGSNESVLGTNLAAGGGVVAGVVDFILTLVTEMWAMISPGISVLLYGGYFLGIWIPMVPFYVFSLGVIGWMIQVGEALAAGALWMVMHLTPERDDSFIGSQQQGYLLLMSLFARPALMVLGVVFSMAALIPAVRFVNAGSILSFRVIQADSVTGLLSVAGFMLVYCVIIFAVFMLVFSLPQTLPDRILRWIGAGIGDLGEQNSMSRIESGASSQARTAAVAMSAKQSGIDRARGNNARRAVMDAEVASSSGQNAVEGHTSHVQTNIHGDPDREA